MIQQCSKPCLTCNTEDHEGCTVSAFCTRAECDQISAACQVCTLELHQNCIPSLRLIKNIPKLVEPYQQIISGLQVCQQSMNELFKELIAIIEQLFTPITQYTNEPYLDNLNELGEFLKKEPQTNMTVNNELNKTLKEIYSLFLEVTQKYRIPILKSENTFSSIITANQSIITDCTEIEEPKVVQKDQKVEDAKVYLEKGNELFSQKKYIEALEQYEQLMKIDQENHQSIWLNKGNILFQSKLYDYACYYYEKVVSTDSNNKNIMLNKGNELFELQDFNQARQYYIKAIEINPTNQNIWLNKGNELFSKKQYDYAKQYYMKAIEINQTNSDIWLKKGTLYIQLANELFSWSEYEKAKQYYLEAIKVNPQLVNILIEKVSALYYLGNYSVSKVYCDQALKINGSVANGQSWLNSLAAQGYK